MKRFLLAALLSCVPAVAWAACGSTISVTDGGGSTQHYCVTTDGSGNYFAGQTIQGGTNGANQLGINSDGSLNAVPTIESSGGLSGSYYVGTGATNQDSFNWGTNATHALTHISAGNALSTPYYLWVYNVQGCTSSTTASDVIWAGIVPGNAAGAGREVDFSGPGLAAASGLCTRQTMNPAVTDTTAIGTNQGLISLSWK